MNYVPVARGTISNESTGTQGELNAGTSTHKEEISQDCIVMPIWKDASYFDSPSKDVGNGELNESDEKDKSEDDSSPKEVNTTGQHVNTVSPEVNTSRFKLNIVDPSVNTASSYNSNSPKDMFKLGASHTLEATHVEFFSDEDEPETRRITKSTSEQGFLSAIYEQKTHDTLNTCNRLDPQALLKLYLIHLGWKQCRKNFCNSNSNKFGNLWICLLERGPLEQNGSSETKKEERRKMKGGL
ncbi:hypothetical protein Tco_0050446 [Tanacetum coccineum]